MKSSQIWSEFNRTFMLSTKYHYLCIETDKTVTYDPMKRVGVAISRIGASEAISIGAYAFALNKIDNNLLK